MIRFVLVFLGFFIATGAQAQDWRLVDANQISPETHLVLTVPLDDPEALEAIASAIEAQYGVPLTAEWPLQAINVHCLIYDASGLADVDGLISDMEADDRIRTVQRIRGFQSSEASYQDPLFPLQWSLNRMNASRAHHYTRGLGIKIGVIDSAIDGTHPDLTARVIDARDFVEAQPTARAEAHGTAVAGVIAAEAQNDIGMVGIAPEAELIGLRACWQAQGAPGQCNSFSLARAINFAILNDIRVLNLSVGGPFDPLLAELITEALAKDTVIIAAAGEQEETAFPASFDGVIAAGGGSTTRVPAPMQDVITTAPGAAHRYASGSSIATAHVSGVVALMLTQKLDLTPGEVADALFAAVDAEGDMPVLDACKAIVIAAGTGSDCSQ